MTAAAIEHTQHSARRRFARARVVVTGLALLLAFLGLASVGTGPVSLSPGQVLAILGAEIGLDFPWQFTEADRAVVSQIRLPRTILGILVGAALAVSGAALQGMFRNPLADPGLIGVSSGAALAAVIVIVVGLSLFGAGSGTVQAFLLPLAAFAGGVAATYIVYRIGTVAGRTDVATMLLAGIAIAAIANAGIGSMIFVADDDQLRTVNFWLLGSLAGATWDLLLPTLPFLLAPVLLAPLFARGLNALLLGESEAGHLGTDVERFKKLLVLLVALAVGAGVAVSGIIAFVGLVVPHILRLVIGPDHRYLLPGAALLGGAMLLAADLASRLVVAPAELPIGILTSLLGGPFFLWLLIRRRSGQGF